MAGNRQRKGLYTQKVTWCHNEVPRFARNDNERFNEVPRFARKMAFKER